MSATWRVFETDGVKTSIGNAFRGVAELIEGAGKRIRQYWWARHTRRQLRYLDDHLLRDIGVRRPTLGYDSGDLRGPADHLASLFDPHDDR